MPYVRPYAQHITVSNDNGRQTYAIYPIVTFAIT